MFLYDGFTCEILGEAEERDNTVLDPSWLLLGY